MLHRAPPKSLSLIGSQQRVNIFNEQFSPGNLLLKDSWDQGIGLLEGLLVYFWPLLFYAEDTGAEPAEIL